MIATGGIGASSLKSIAPALIFILFIPLDAGRAATKVPEGRLFFSACPEPRDGVSLLPEEETCAVESSELFSMDPAGEDRKRLTDNDYFEQNVLASPSKRRLVLTISPDQSCDPFAYDFDGYLATMAFDGSRSRTLTSPSDHLCDHATDWSSTRSRILFTRAAALATNVMRIRTKTRQVTALTRFGYESDKYADSAQRIAKESRVVFTAPGKKTYDIFVSRPDGSRRRALRTDNLFEAELKVSPNQRWIAFTGTSRRGGPDLYVMRPDGTSRKRLTFSAELSESHLRWSPDNRFLLFEAFDNEDGSDSYISTIRRDGSRLQTLTTSDEDFDRAWVPYWSPDGTRIAFLGEQLRSNEAFAVYVMNADGSGKRRLTDWDELTWLWGWIAPPVD